jgi:hypothetical protein
VLTMSTTLPLYWSSGNSAPFSEYRISIETVETAWSESRRGVSAGPSPLRPRYGRLTILGLEVVELGRRRHDSGALDSRI